MQVRQNMDKMTTNHYRLLLSSVLRKPSYSINCDGGPQGDGQPTVTGGPQGDGQPTVTGSPQGDSQPTVTVLQGDVTPTVTRGLGDVTPTVTGDYTGILHQLWANCTTGPYFLVPKDTVICKMGNTCALSYRVQISYQSGTGRLWTKVCIQRCDKEKRRD